MYTVIERVVFPGEDKFAVMGPCGNEQVVYTTHPTRKGANKIAARMNAEAATMNDPNYVGSAHHY